MELFTAELIYIGELRTEAIHVRSGNRFFTDAPPDNQGKGEAFSPTDLAATSLASCMLTTMGISARGHNINIDGIKASVRKHMASNPRRISKIEIQIDLQMKELNEAQKRILEKAAHTCPVAISLHPDVEQLVEFIYRQ